MTYGDDRTAGAMSDDERRDYVRQDGAAMAAPPDGPSRDLRERCAHAYYRLRWARDDWQHMAPVHREAYYEVADAILTEITRSGHSIIATDRLERLIEAATMYESDLLETCGQYTELTRQCTSVLELGDLERIGGGR